jgi:4-hydroxythreonine-4-phosphate dehydrogenase
VIASQQRADAPILALTIGDPVGIGPEIVARTLAEPPDDVIARGLAVGDARSVRRAAKVSNLDVQVRSVERVADARFEPGVIDVLEQDCLSTDLPWGKVQAEAGRAAIAAIESAATAALRGEVAAVVTAPINKEAIWAAGSRHLGHTEMLAEITGSARVQTVFLIRGLKVFFTTRHSSLREAIG